MSERPKTVRFLRWVGVALLVAVFGVYLGLPFVMGVVAIVPGGGTVGTAPVGAQSVTLETDDGVTLDAWYAPPAAGTAIVLVHGAGSSREGVRRYFEFLVNHGFGVLALDLRGHGTSGGKTNRLGWESTHDVAAAVEFLHGRDEVKRIGALGLSMGGEVLLGASGDLPDIQAIVAEGATRRTVDDIMAMPSERSLVRNFTARVMLGTVGLFRDEDEARPLLESMRASGATRFLLIPARAEPLEITANELYASELGERATLWIAEEGGHTGALSAYPDEYVGRVVSFFNMQLGE